MTRARPVQRDLTEREQNDRDPTGLLARLRAANAGQPPGDWQRENLERWRRANPDRLAPFMTTATVIGDTGEDTEPVEPEPVKRRKRKPSIASVIRQMKRAGVEVAGYEMRPDGSIKVITGKPAGASDTDDTTSPDPRWN